MKDEDQWIFLHRLNGECNGCSHMKALVLKQDELKCLFSTTKPNL